VNPPSSVQILGREWKVELAPDLLVTANAHGMALSNEGRILLWPAAPQPATIIHELIHAVEHELGFELPEKTVKRVSTGLSAVLADNPKLRLYLLEASQG
jgi:hypothetical protein